MSTSPIYNRLTYLALGAAALAVFDVGFAMRRSPEAITAATFALMTWSALGSAFFVGAIVSLLRFGLRRVAKAPYSAPLGAATDGIAFTFLVLWMDPPASMSEGMRLAAGLVVFVVVALLSYIANRWSLPRGVLVALALIAVAACTRLPITDKLWTRLALSVVALECIGALGLRAKAFGRWQRTVLALVVAAALTHPFSLLHPATRAFAYLYAPFTRALCGPLDDLRQTVGHKKPLVGRRSCTSAVPCLAGKAQPLSPLSTTAKGADVIIISIDALRWDQVKHLKLLEQEMGEHLRFSKAVSPAPKTRHALAAMLRGVPVRLVPFSSKVLHMGVSPRASQTLATRLKRDGYRAVHVATHRFFQKEVGINAGFEVIKPKGFSKVLTPVPGQITAIVRAPTAAAKALEVAQTTQEPLLMWIHFMDSHEPYYWKGGSGPNSRKGQTRSLRYLDRVLSKFMHDLRAARADRPRIVAVLGDHGEEFGEHGGRHHGSSVFGEQVRVGFMLGWPAAKSAVVAGPVSTAALPATVLDLLGLEPSCSFRIASVLPCAADESQCPPVMDSQMVAAGKWVGYTSSKYRFLYDPDHDIRLLFDTQKDPKEAHNIISSRPDAAADMLKLISTYDQSFCTKAR